MNCQEVKGLIYKHLDNELSLKEEEALFAHINICPHCGFEFDEAIKADQLLKQVIVPVDPPLDLTARIMAQIPHNSNEVSSALNRQGKNWWEIIKEGWKNFAGNWQLRTAAVSLGVLALVLFGNSFYQPPQVADQDQPEIIVADSGQKDPGTEAVLTPDKENPTESDQGKTSSDTDPNQENSNSDDAEAVIDNKEPQPSQAEVKPVESVITNVIELPQPTNEENRIKTMEIITLAQNLPGDAKNPVLVLGGEALRFIVSNDGKNEEWELPLKAGAVPQKVLDGFLINQEQDSTENSLPDNLANLESVKGADSLVLSWSGDKKQLALNLNSEKDEIKGLWIVQGDGTNEIHQTKVGGGAIISWSPDNHKIAFTDENNGLYVYYLRENLLIQVTNSAESFYEIDHLIWTPDSQKIIFDGKRNAAAYSEIYSVDLP